MIKVYCSECVWFIFNPIDRFCSCNHESNSEYRDTPIRQYVSHIQTCEEKNTNNDCKYYERKSIK